MSRRRNEEGVVLIAMLWILSALAVIALSFSREGFVEVSAARNARDLSDGYYIARAGLNAAIYQLIERRLTPRVQQLELPQEPEPIDLGKVGGTFSDGSYEVDIQDESGKLNLNMINEEQLRLLLEVTGIQKPDSDIIVDSVMDWRDADNAYRLNGAEDEYYQRLPRPYKAKNSRFETVEELLLVRGVTREYYYGYAERAPDESIAYRYGLSRYLTTYSTSNRVNVNYAPLQVLMSVPGMPPDAARFIFERRQTRPFANIEELNRELPTSLGSTTLPFLSTDQTHIYTLTAFGRREGARARRAIRAVVNLDPREKKRHWIMYWNENVPNL
ncbi:MAG: general secretion pathway protein GspK [Acidobacteria bacterium]|nr:general secretion pathway protein GspK [Acidobacteriota bacterium]